MTTHHTITDIPFSNPVKVAEAPEPDLRVDPQHDGWIVHGTVYLDITPTLWTPVWIQVQFTGQGECERFSATFRRPTREHDVLEYLVDVAREAVQKEYLDV